MGYDATYQCVKNRQTAQSAGLTKRDSYEILDLEIDQSIESTLSSGLCDISERDIPLHDYANIPEYLKGNPYVTDGYRVSLPFTLCLKRLFKFVICYLTISALEISIFFC